MLLTEISEDDDFLEAEENGEAESQGTENEAETDDSEDELEE